MMKLGNITFDCADPARQAQFWAAALGYEIVSTNELYAELNAAGAPARVLLIKVPEPKSAKNRMHLDFVTEDREAEVARLVSLGARRGESHTMYGVNWTVLQDPEGNEFCIAQR